MNGDRRNYAKSGKWKFEGQRNICLLEWRNYVVTDYKKKKSLSRDEHFFDKLQWDQVHKEYEYIEKCIVKISFPPIIRSSLMKQCTIARVSGAIFTFPRRLYFDASVLSHRYKLIFCIIYCCLFENCVFCPVKRRILLLIALLPLGQFYSYACAL